MAQSGFNPGLRRKIGGQAGAGGPAQAVPRPDGIDSALSRALGKAAAPFDGLALDPGPEPPQWDIRPPAIAAALPDMALVTLLEAGGEARALCALDPGLVDALIEVQTTGRVEAVQGKPRPPTRIDAALTRDFLGLFLGALAGELAGREGVDWPLALSYGAHLDDPDQLDLLLPDQPFHLFGARPAMGDGGRHGRILLAVPVIPRQATAGPDDSPDTARWRAAWQAALAAAPVPLEAVLMRRTLPLARIETLQPGDLLSFDPEELAAADVRDVTGRSLFRARIGRAGGCRALRLTDGQGLAAPRPVPAPDPAPGPAAPTPPGPDQAENAAPSPA